jgi:hypothetical protein
MAMFIWLLEVYLIDYSIDRVPRPPPSGIESSEPRGSAGERGDVGRPAIAFAKFYYAKVF